jgi:hypothetical protein
MLMVIFGAGASFDSSSTYPVGQGPPDANAEDSHNAFYRPPLAKDLFANRPIFMNSIEAFPQCKPIVPRLRAPAVISGALSIEGLLQTIEAEAAAYPPGLRELAAVRCYLQRAIGDSQNRWIQVTRGITNYLWLLREIERTRKDAKPVCLVTFNYDTLLENALGALSADHRIDRMEDYMDRPTLFRVFKPHGSINWAQMVENEIPGNINVEAPTTVLRYLIDHAEALRITNEFALCPPGAMGVVNRMPAFPAIAIPVEKKNQFACPQTHLDRLAEVLTEVSKILMIGWRATEAHFLTLLKQHLRPGVQVCVVAGNLGAGRAAQVCFYTALANNRLQIPTIDAGGFTDFLTNGNVRTFLEF